MTENCTRVLLIEDDTVDQLAFKRLVKEAQLAYAYTVAGSVSEARTLLAAETFDIVIMDYLLGDGTAFDVLDAVPSDLPVIFATGAGDEEIAVKAMKSGATDYLIKDIERNYLKILPVTVEQTLQRKKERQEVEQLRESMLHMMIHDLRSPLGVIFTSLQFLESDTTVDLSEDHRRLLQISFNNAQKLNELINSILDVSRLESGHMLLDYANIKLQGLAADVLRAQSPLADEKDLHLENDVPVTLPDVWADKDLIERVLQNLIHNAIKFTPSGGTIRVSAQRAPQDPTLILVHVSDTGPGIQEGLQSQLFQKFITGKQKGRGSGLGLAFCKLVLEAHKQNIWVESQMGHGTTFSFSLQVYQEEV